MARVVILERVATPDTGSASAITVKNLSKMFSAPAGGARFTVLESISLFVHEGEFVSIVGPSGCGKSTLLNIIAGIESYEGGSVAIAPRAAKAGSKSGSKAGSEPGSEPRVGYVFQSPRLLNWLTVEDNINFVLEAQNIPRSRWKELVTRNLEMVGLGGQQRNYPLNLSGGMQQRVAIARALAIEPDILLMDEPFSHLDAITARKMRFDLSDILTQAKPTILYVTHDLAEAVFLSDRIYMMDTKPARIFKEVRVGVSRPRAPEDSKILDLEKILVREFFGALETKT
ncbi:MAG TPA: ABC transporter ATP-binding protein [Xanthobacteraceae bacterium]|nr:ABC transporter ATP-binding protein [Xanthobacteraceae bacterium]